MGLLDAEKMFDHVHAVGLAADALSLDSLKKNRAKRSESVDYVHGTFEKALRIYLDAAESTGNLDGQRDDRVGLEESALNEFKNSQNGSSNGDHSGIWIRNLRNAHLCFYQHQEKGVCEVVTLPRQETQKLVDNDLFAKFSKIYSDLQSSVSDVQRHCEANLVEETFSEKIGTDSEVTQRKVNSMFKRYGYERVSGKRKLKKYIISEGRMQEIGAGRHIFMKDSVIFIPTVKDGELKVTGHQLKSKAERVFFDRLSGKKKDYGDISRKLFAEKFNEIISSLIKTEQAMQPIGELIADALAGTFVKLGVSKRKSGGLANKMLKLYTNDQRNV